MSVLAKEIKKHYENSREFIELGFQELLKAGELLAEVEQLSGAEKVEEWLHENCSGIDTGQAFQGLRLFKGEKIKVEASTKPTQKEVQES